MVLEEPTVAVTNTNTDIAVQKAAKPEKPLKDKLEKAKTKDKARKDKDRRSIKYPYIFIVILPFCVNSPPLCPLRPQLCVIFFYSSLDTCLCIPCPSSRSQTHG